MSSRMRQVRSFHVTDDVHDLGHIHVHAALVDDSQRRIHFLGEEARALHAASVRRNHRQVRKLQIPEKPYQHRRRKQVVHRNVEESLNLRRMQINYQRPVGPCGRQQVSHQLRADRDARPVLAVLPGVSEIRNHHRDAARRGAFQRIDQQQQLQQVLVHRIARRLNQENVSHRARSPGSAHTSRHPRTCNARLPQRQAKLFADFLGQRVIRRAGEDLPLVFAARAHLLGLRVRGRLLLLVRRLRDSRSSFAGRRRLALCRVLRLLLP